MECLEIDSFLARKLIFPTKPTGVEGGGGMMFLFHEICLNTPTGSDDALFCAPKPE